METGYYSYLCDYVVMETSYYNYLCDYVVMETGPVTIVTCVTMSSWRPVRLQ